MLDGVRYAPFIVSMCDDLPMADKSEFIAVWSKSVSKQKFSVRSGWTGLALLYRMTGSYHNPDMRGLRCTAMYSNPSWHHVSTPEKPEGEG